MLALCLAFIQIGLEAWQKHVRDKGLFCTLSVHKVVILFVVQGRFGQMQIYGNGLIHKVLFSINLVHYLVDT